MAATIWPAGASPLRPLWEAMSDAAGAPPATPLPPELDFERSTTGLGGLLHGAGLRDVQTSTPSWIWEVSPQSLWRAVEGGIAAIGAVYRRAPADVRVRMREVFDRETAARASASGVLILPHEAILAVGTR